MFQKIVEFLKKVLHDLKKRFTPTTDASKVTVDEKGEILDPKPLTKGMRWWGVALLGAAALLLIPKVFLTTVIILGSISYAQVWLLLVVAGIYLVVHDRAPQYLYN